MKITNLKNINYKWTWKINVEDAEWLTNYHYLCPKEGEITFYTNENGNGIWWEDINGEGHQISGTAQFQSCKTKSGMYKKIKKYSTY